MVLKSLATCALVTVPVALLLSKGAMTGSRLSSSSRLPEELFMRKPMNLPPSLRAQYEDDGFVVVRNVLPKGATEALIHELERTDLLTPEPNIFLQTVVLRFKDHHDAIHFLSANS